MPGINRNRLQSLSDGCVIPDTIMLPTVIQNRLRTGAQDIFFKKTTSAEPSAVHLCYNIERRLKGLRSLKKDNEFPLYGLKIYCYKRSEKVVIVVLIEGNRADVSQPFSLY